MRALAVSALLWMTAAAAQADSAADRLFDAMGLADLVVAFAEDGREAASAINQSFLGGQGGSVFAETVEQLYDPARLEAELRAGFAKEIEPQTAQQAEVFLASAQGVRIVALEVQARQAMVDDTVEEAARAASDRASAEVLRLLSVRDLVDVNTDIAMAARFAFYDGVRAATPGAESPDIEGQRDMVAEDTRQWITGYYMLVASALEPDDMDVYAAFWETDVGRAVDAALARSFENTYATLSFGLGQMVGRLLPQNDL